MVEVVFLSRVDNLASICYTAADIYLDVFRPDNLGQVLQRVQNLVAQVAIDNFITTSTPVSLVQSIRPHLLLYDLLAAFPEFLLEVKIVEH